MKAKQFKVTAMALIVAMLTPQFALAAEAAVNFQDKAYSDMTAEEKARYLSSEIDKQRAAEAKTKADMQSVVGGNQSGGLFRQSQSTENCDDISAAVAEQFANTARLILPDNPDDNVYSAVANSGAEAANEGGFLDGVFSFDLSSISLLGSSIWSAITAMAEKVIETAKKAAMRALKNAAKSAVQAGIRAINTAYAKQLSKISNKLGFAGPILTTALGGVVPSITNTAGSCAMNLDANCADKIANAVSQSVSYGTEAAVRQTADSAGRMAEAAAMGAVDRAVGKAREAVNKHAPNVVRDAANQAIGSAQYDMYMNSEAIGNGVRNAVNQSGKAATERWNAKPQGNTTQPKPQNNLPAWGESGGGTNFLYQ